MIICVIWYIFTGGLRQGINVSPLALERQNVLVSIDNGFGDSSPFH